MKYVQRTYRLLEHWGWHDWWNVEIYNPYSGKKTDLFHIIDTLVLTDNGVIGVQTCGKDFSEHVRKMMHDERVNTSLWLATPGTKLLLIGWRKIKGRRGGKAWKYLPRIAWITMNKKGRLHIAELPLER